jgi:hypothetical protein
MSTSPLVSIPFVIPGADAWPLDPELQSPMFSGVDTGVQPPGQVTGLTVGVITNGSVALTWTAPATGGVASDYLVEHRVHPAGGWTPHLVGSATAAYLLSGLSSSTKYDIRVSAMNVAAAGVPSTEVTATTKATYEAGATAHWMYGTDSSSLADLKSNQAITPLNTAPTYSDGFLSTVTSTTLKNGLQTNINNVAEETLCIVFRHRTASLLSIIMGNLTATGADNGMGFFQNGAGVYYMNTRGFTTGSAAVIANPAGIADGDWLFFAVSHTITGTAGRRAFFGGNAASEFQAGTRTLSTANPKHCVGNGYYTASSFPAGVDVAEFIILPTALDEAAMKDVYARSKIRCAARGIAVH